MEKYSSSSSCLAKASCTLFIRNRATPFSMHSVPAVPRQPFRICRRKKVRNFLLLSKRKHAIIPVGNLKVELPMKEEPDVLQGTLGLMVLKILDVLGPQHGYG